MSILRRCSPGRMHWLATFIVGLLSVVPGRGSSQAQPLTRPSARLPAQTVPPPNKLEFRLAPSRGEINAGQPFGIIGTVANTSSDSIIYVTQQSLSITLPPELSANRLLETWHAYFPTEQQVSTSRQRFPSESIVVALRPGQRTTVGWSPTPYRSLFVVDSSKQPKDRPFLARTIDAVVPKTLRYFTFFTPGDYQLAIQVKYWTDSTRPPLAYSATTETVTLHMLAPLIVILLGAAFGGVMASTITLLQHGRHTIGHYIHKGFWAAMWSTLVAILISRTAEAQLPIKVTVTDVWGGITIGVIAYFLGARWLRRLIDQRDQSRTNHIRTHE